jgi:hypothetical protein
MKAIVISGHMEIPYHSPALKKTCRIFINNLIERGYVEDGYRSGRIIHEYLGVCELQCVSGFGSAIATAQTSSGNRLTL